MTQSGRRFVERLEASVHRGTAITAVAVSVALAGASQHAAAQADVSRAAYPSGEGPVVVLDLGHNNVDDPEFPPILAEWLTQDGYVVRQLATRFDEATLASVDLVISRNPLSAYNRDNWTLPTPSAFSRGEIELLYNWILSGGALLLVVDHMPIPGAAEELLSTFNFEISNGFALDERSLRGYDEEVIHAAGRISFRRSDGSLADHPVTNGRTLAERVDSIVTAVGSAFRLPPDGQSLLTFGPSFVSLLPESSWEFDDTTPRQAIEGWSQAGLARVGSGRVAILGDSMLLRSALEDTETWALQNPQFTLNLVHWLSGLLDGR